MGTGAAFAGASQYGTGKVTSTADAGGGLRNPVVGNVTASSEVAQGTFSNATVTNAGVAKSGSSGYAQNSTVAKVGSSGLVGGASATATGTTTGSDTVKTWGSASSGDSVDAGGGSYQKGTFDGTITRTFSAPTFTITSGPGGCVVGCSGNDTDPDKKPKGNNGFGNGDQDAPGGSGGHNGAENDLDGKRKSDRS
jgi:hypothetical protein